MSPAGWNDIYLGRKQIAGDAVDEEQGEKMMSEFNVADNAIVFNSQIGTITPQTMICLNGECISHWPAPIVKGGITGAEFFWIGSFWLAILLGLMWREQICKLLTTPIYFDKLDKRVLIWIGIAAYVVIGFLTFGSLEAANLKSRYYSSYDELGYFFAGVLWPIYWLGLIAIHIFL